MRRLTVLSLFLMMALAASAALAADAPPVDQLTKELMGQAPAPQRSPEELLDAYGQVIDALIPQFAPDKDGAQLTLQNLVFRALRPGAEAERLAVCKAMLGRLGANQTVLTRVWLLKQLEFAAHGEAVDAAAALLDDKEPLVREHARKVLQRNPDPQAGVKLRAALDKATDPSWRAGLATALGYRQDAEAVPALVKMLGDKDALVSTAAAQALGEIGGDEAVKGLDALRKANPQDPTLRRQVANSYLECADKLAAAGKKDEAVALYQPLMAPGEVRRLRLAAFHGIVMARGEAAVPLVLQTLNDKDPLVQATASRMLVTMPGEAVTKAAADQLKGAAPEVQVVVLRALSDRGDPAALPAVLDMTKSADEPVRMAAFEALGKLGDASVVPLLAGAAAAGGAVQRVARDSLGRLPGTDVDGALLAALPGAEPKVRGELVRALAARRATAAIPALYQVAAKDPEESIRSAAVDALDSLGGPAQLSQFVLLFMNAKGDDERGAAEKAITDTFEKVADPEERAAPVLLAAKGASGPVRLSLLRMLGKTGSPAALEVLRAALKEEDAKVKDSVVQALADWPDAAAAPDLLAIAKNAGENKTHRVLALRGYVREVCLPSTRPGAETVKMLQDAMAIINTADERKMVLAGLADVSALEALKMAQPLVGNDEVKAEAVVAVVKIARAISGAYHDEALAALRQVRPLTNDENLIRQIDDGIDVITKFEDYITDWMMAGPYMAAGKDGAGLFDVAFAPEKPDAQGIKWVRAPASPDKNKPWEVNFQATDFRGNDRVAYIKTRVQSPKQQEVQLQIGSDDGVKVWLNGQLVHQNNTSRADTPGQDKVKVTLKEGWNDLLMKICNGGGDWGACARFRTLDGDKLEGLKTQAE